MRQHGKVKKLPFGNILNNLIILLINQCALWVILMKCLMHPKKIVGISLSPIKVQQLNDFLKYSNNYDATVQGRLLTWKKISTGTIGV